MHIYLITNLINGKQYVGAEKGNSPNYFGSGRLIIEAIEEFGKKNFKKEIIVEDVDNWEECLELESFCISLLGVLEPDGYNQKIYQWPPSIEASRRGGKRTKELGVGAFAPENLGKGSKIGGKTTGRANKELKRGWFAPGMQSKAGKIGGEIGAKKCKELKIGIFAPKNFGKGGKISGKRNVELGRGWFNPKMRSEWNKRCAHVYFEIDGLIQQMTLGALLKT